MIDRKVFMDPPPERKKDGVIWKLNKSVYGLNDTKRKWLKKIGETLTQLGCKKSKFYHYLFTYWKESQLEGIILLWVDNIFHAGTKKLDRDIIKKVANKFKIGNTEKNSFIYVGLNIKTPAAGITLNQTHYTNRLETAKLRARPNNRPTSKDGRSTELGGYTIKTRYVVYSGRTERKN